jgi:tRNA/rRNA methyltransferase
LVDNLRAVLTRPGFTESEIRLVRGVISSLDRFTREAPRGAGAPENSRANKVDDTGDDT